VLEVSIGHALIADALETGLRRHRARYLAASSAAAASDLRHRHRHLRRAAHPRVAGAHGDRFARKILSEAEFATWKARSARWPERGVRYLATRFSAKEAFSKAVGPGHAHAHDLAPVRGGQARQRQAGDRAARRAEGLVRARGLSAQVSVTDETDYAASFVVVEQKEKNHE
jgi:holo-[acyl-carrier-protein] synthase